MHMVIVRQTNVLISILKWTPITVFCKYLFFMQYWMCCSTYSVRHIQKMWSHKFLKLKMFVFFIRSPVFLYRKEQQRCSLIRCSHAFNKITILIQITWSSHETKHIDVNAQTYLSFYFFKRLCLLLRFFTPKTKCKSCNLNLIFFIILYFRYWNLSCLFQSICIKPFS